ncbi:MAG: protein-L-isoaspartate O-methyltransferase [Rhodospirillaceae bacterium]|jgi:protein-L-isoaspartate(D-aspartate) O-methyltransferase|nr:protein-L-isoaspartate O-methyltransferase [Rhodospirillaceae bacterium]MBT5667241.1 protein-L-isoaspartate O-methyltransferase [Rhodospirillaceae bacterium]
MDFSVARRHMVDCQIRPNQVTDENLISQFETVPRERFAPSDQQALAYLDADLPIAENRRLMNPCIMARMLQTLSEGNSGIALVVGCGSGYVVAVLSGMFDCVFALESDPGLAAEATRVLSELAVDNAVVVEGPLEGGWAKEGPYNAIFIDGGVMDIPDGVSDQLADGGKLTAVTLDEGGTGRAVLLERRGASVSRRTLFDAAIPPLKEFDKLAGFVF